MRILRIIVWIYQIGSRQNCLSFDILFIYGKLGIFSQFNLKELGSIKRLKKVIRLHKTL